MTGIDLPISRASNEDASSFIDKIWDKQMHFSGDTISTFLEPTIRDERPSGASFNYMLMSFSELVHTKPLATIEIHLPPSWDPGYIHSLRQKLLPSPDALKIENTITWEPEEFWVESIAPGMKKHNSHSL